LNHHKKPTDAAKYQPLETVMEFGPNNGLVILQPIVMRVPNKYGIYSPSKLRPKKEVSYREFLLRYADHARIVRVCFQEELTSEKKMFQHSKLITAYNFGLGCWYVVTLPAENAQS
jgi:hypothetical protein